MAMNENQKIGSADRVFDIIELVRNRDGVTASTVAEEIDSATSTAYQYLRTIEDNGFLVEEDGKFYLSLRFLDYGGHAINRQQAHDLAKAKVKELAESTGERAQYVVPQDGEGVVLHIISESQAVKTGVRIGTRVPLHASAAGKAILAFLPERELFDIIEHGKLEQYTEHTITDPDQLLAELEDIRDEEVAFNDQEQMDRLRAVGVPVRDPNNEIIGALSVAAPSNRFIGETFTKEMPDLLRGMANEMELNIEYGE